MSTNVAERHVLNTQTVVNMSLYSKLLWLWTRIRWKLEIVVGSWSTTHASEFFVRRPLSAFCRATAFFYTESKGQRADCEMVETSVWSELQLRPHQVWKFLNYMRKNN